MLHAYMNQKKENTYWNIPGGQLHRFNQLLAEALGAQGQFLVEEALEDPILIEKVVRAWQMALPTEDENSCGKGEARRIMGDRYISLQEAIEVTGFDMSQKLNLPRVIPFSRRTLRKYKGSCVLLPLLPLCLLDIADIFPNIVYLSSRPCMKGDGAVCKMAETWVLVHIDAAYTCGNPPQNEWRGFHSESEIAQVLTTRNCSRVDLTQTLYVGALLWKLRKLRILSTGPARCETSDQKIPEEFEVQFRGKLEVLSVSQVHNLGIMVAQSNEPS